MAAWQPPDEAMDPELALALELDLLSDQELLDAVGVAWPAGLPDVGTCGAAHAPAPAPAPWPVDTLLPQLPAWPPAAGEQPLLPVLGLAPAGLGPGWHVEAAEAGAAGLGPTAATASATAGAGRAAASASCKPNTPRRGGRAGSGTSRYDKPGARERKQEQQRAYRLRVKERTAEQQAQLAALGAAVDAERQQQQQLLDEHAALQKVQEYKDSLAEQLPLADGGAAQPAEDSSAASGTQAVEAGPPEASSWAALTSGAAAEDCGGATCSSTAKLVEISGGVSGSSDGHGGACSSEGGGSGSAALGSKDGDWEPVFPTHWCQVGLAAGSGLPPPAVALVDAAAALEDKQHALPYEGSGGLLSGMAAALLAVPDALCRRLMGGIKPYQLADRERGFRNLIKAAVEEWEANPAGRRRMEYRLKILWAVRLKCSGWLARIRPEVVAEARASYVLPAPLPATAAAVTGSQASGEGGVEGGVHHMLPPIVAKLHITPEQRDRILAHWRTYQQRVAVARQLSREAIQRLQCQEAARQQSGIPGTNGSLAGAAGHFLSSLQAVSELAALPPEETAAWFELQHGLWQALTPLQNSRLLLGCAPYLPDCTQLCRLLEWQQQRQQLSRGDSGHFLATAVTVGGPAE